MSKLKKSELTVGRKVAYKQSNNFSLATILEIKSRVKIDDEGEERWVTPESLHSLDRLEKGNYSKSLQMVLSVKNVTADTVTPFLEQLGLSSKIASIVAMVIVFLIGLVFTYFTTGELSIMPGSESEDSSSDSATEYVSPIISSVSGDWYDLYFTSPSYPDRPENRPAEVPIIEGLVSAINSAKETLDIAIYELNLPEIGEAVLAAQRRGVMVRLVTDSDEIDHLEVLIDLNKNGIPMVGDQREAIMHNKFVVVDKQAVWTGSWNFTPNGTYRNNNNAIYIKSPELAELYHQEFEELYNGEFGPRSPSNPTKQVLLNDTMIEVCFAPEDNCGNRLIALVNQAQSSIHVMAFSFTHDGIGEAIVARGNAGVEVRAVFERRSSDTEHSELGRLQKAGFDVVTDGNPYTYHHKVIVVDGQTVALGSFNFSENADSSNDENILIIDNPKIATEYIKEFERNYQRATE